MQEEISNLQPIVHKVDGKEVTIISEIYQTMHDGKNRNSIYGTVLQKFMDKGKIVKKHGGPLKIDFQTCWVCLQHPKHYNSLDETLFIYDKEWFREIVEFGCNPLHLKNGVIKELRTASVAKIIGREETARANIGNGKYTAKQKEKRRKHWERKYQEDFIKNVNGLRVGFPDRRGGNTDRGNTADRILQNAKKTAKILRVKSRMVVIIRKLIVMLNQTHVMPNIGEYKRLARRGQELYVKTFGSYRTMSAAMHFVFQHGHLYLAWAEEKGLPLGAFSECSVEHDNQCRRNMDTHHSRWTGVKEKSEDMIKGTCWRLVKPSHPTLHYSTLLYTTLHYSTLLYTTLYYSILLYTTL